MKLLCLGDSYTIGEGVAEEETWPSQIQLRLNDKGLSINKPRVIAQTGWSGAELEHALEGEALSQTFDLVTLLIGVNDQYRGHTIESFAPSYERLLDRALDLAGGSRDRVIAISIPDWGVTPFAKDRDSRQISREIDAFNQYEKELCHQRKTSWVDITQLSRELGRLPGMLIGDNLHPSKSQYMKWVDKILPCVNRQLQQGRSE